ncbi:head-tail adaptor protein [Phenylobacterium sp.]|uniref:phage head completion protein n=1 Tax=Phenylobacterium sp. TaxID=1871053 RepID=UPI0025E95322|nr:head-tail adaptor protein [Phenylobacterium sp.]MBX3482534.1 head-tail adaptor protein [Phenylobacterium sp.]MCW5759242.1 head-tail adaptor protein [Phenylobacterium sp.]
MISAGDLTRAVTILKHTPGAKDAGGHPTVTYPPQAPSLFAKRTDVRDGEKLGRDGVAATLTTRFILRTEDAGDVNERDRIRDDDFDETFEIVGVKRLGPEWREITCGKAA